MTNVLAPYSESKLIYNGYVNTGLLDGTMSFVIPIYDNMPELPVESPNILDTDFIADNTQVYANVQTGLNIRSGPGTSYESLATVPANTEMTRIAKGKQSGELWDRVKLSNGMVGYAFQNYLKEVPKKQIEQIYVSIDNTTITKGETKKLIVEILPVEAANNEVEYRSSNSNIVRVDSSGNIMGIRSGTATITVKAKQNNVSDQIEIQVYSPVTDMNLNIESVMLQVGESFKITPVILPDDATNTKVNYYSENENIVQIDSDGKITAIGEGKTKIIVTTEDANISKEVNVTVIPKIDAADLSFDASLTVTANEITGWNVKEMLVQQIREKIHTIYDIEVYNSKGELLQENELAGTGSTIRLLKDGQIIMEYHIILYGDVNGDGKINSVDLLVLQRHILEIEKFSGVFLKAGNVRKDGKNPSSLDCLLIQRHILEIQMLEQ